MIWLPTARLVEIEGNISILRFYDEGRRALFDVCKPGAGTVTLPAGMAVIASALSLTPETFSRELRRLVEQDLISVHRNSIYVHDTARLKKILA